MMINVSNGDIFIAGGTSKIRKGLNKDEFINSSLFKEVLQQQEHTFTNYYLKPQQIGNDKFIIVLFFNPSNILDSISIGLTRDGEIPSWENWSESEELKLKNEHDKWLEKNIGKSPYKYPWGEISSNYDPRSGSSSIIIRYYE